MANSWIIVPMPCVGVEPAIQALQRRHPGRPTHARMSAWLGWSCQIISIRSRPPPRRFSAATKDGWVRMHSSCKSSSVHKNVICNLNCNKNYSTYCKSCFFLKNSNSQISFSRKINCRFFNCFAI